MYFLFVDESGSPENSDRSMLFTLVGTVFKLENYKPFTKFYTSLRHSFYPEIMSQQLTGNYKKDKSIRDIQELKNILQPSKYDKRNNRFMKILLHKTINYYNISVHPVIFIKPELENKASSSWIYPYAFKRLITSFNNFLNSKNDTGIIILDSRDPGSDDKLVISFYNYSAKNPFGVKCTNVIGPPFFARSNVTFGLQFAHHIAFIIYGHYYNVYYSRQGGIQYNHLCEYWGELENTDTIYGNLNNLHGRGIIVFE